MTKEPLPDFEIRWARAVERDRQNNRYLSDIEADFRTVFRAQAPFESIFLGGTDRGIGATIFFEKDADIPECEHNGTSQAMRDFIYQRLAHYGRAVAPGSVEFEFDSDENVQRNFEGNYFLRMHG